MRFFTLIKVLIATLLFLAYPYLVYQGMGSGLVWLAPLLISILYAYQASQTQNAKKKLLKLLLALALLIGAFFLQSVTAKLMPIIIQLLMMFFFGRTLFTGSPLIERFVRYDYPDLPNEVVIYARQLTWLWTGFFAFNALMCAVLALFASDYWWAIYNGVMIYSLTFLLMVGEYIYRHFRFPGWEIPSPMATARNIIINSRSIWKDAHN